LHAAERIDAQTSEAFQAELLAAVADGGTNLIIDFAQVEYISSAGFRALRGTAPRPTAARRTRISQLAASAIPLSRFDHN
jgi:anti-anti-sigma factor